MKNFNFSAMRNEDAKMKMKMKDEALRIQKKISSKYCTFQDVMINVKQLKIIKVNQIKTTLFFFISIRVNCSICLRFSQFDPEVMLDGILNFKTHFMV